MAGNESTIDAKTQMSLNLYRRHCDECKAGRAPDSRTGEFEERKKGWKRCGCSIFASGTLKGKFKRRSAGVATWDEAKSAIADWKNWDNELPAPVPSPTDKSAIPAKVTIEKAVKDFLAEHEGESANSTIRDYRYLLNHFLEASSEKGFIVLEQWGPAEIREFRKSWKVAANTAAKKMAILKTFFEFCLSNEWIPFTDEELTRMYQACETSYGKGKYEYRYSWSGQDLEDFISVSIYTGLRISDVATFHTDRLRKSGECHIRTTKAGKKVNTWIPEWLQKRIRERARLYGARIFGTSESPNPDVITDLWRRKLKRLWKLCGPWDETPVHHRFRHTFVRILLQTDGVEIREVAELIGDTEESVRKHYAAWVPERQARVTKVLRDAFANKPKPNFLKTRKTQA
jgi:integrase